MKRLFVILCILLCVVPMSRAGGNDGELRRGSTCHVYVSPSASPVIILAADELEDHLRQVLDVRCVRRESDGLSPVRLVLSPVGEEKAFPAGLSAGQQPGEDGYCLDLRDGRVDITGGNDRGVLYGVYSFLEKYLGCRWYTSEVSCLPRLERVSLPAGVESYTPPVRWREVYYYGLCDPVLAGRLKLNGNAQGKGEVAPHRRAIRGGTHAGWGLWCHSLYTLVPPALYATHPEYFAEVDGRRVPPRQDGTQLCLTQPDLPGRMEAALDSLMQVSFSGLPVWADSSAHYWSVSQMDGGGNCQCADCRASDAYDGSPSGTMLKLVNRVAARFPDKDIATLAYTYTRKPPLHTRPAANVVIQLCAIETARQGINLPIATASEHAAFRQDLMGWGRICNQIVVWDYEVQFQNLVSPFPNFSTMQGNINFYVDNHVNAIFCQGNREKGGELAELRGYLLAKLLWNPHCDLEAEMDGFLNGYYGPAGVYIKQYITDMETSLKQSGARLSMDGEPEAHRHGYLSEACLARYRRYFDQAEQAVAHRPELLKRVRKERMPLLYAQIRLGYGPAKERLRMLEELNRLAAENDVWMFSEVDWREDQSGNREMFYRKYRKLLDAELARL